MKKIIAVSICCYAFGLVSCYYKVTCPEFNEEILSWIPYQANDAFELYSQSNDSTIIFLITRVEVTHTTHFERGVDCDGGNCDDQIIINNGNSNFKVDIRLRKNEIKNQSYQISDTHFAEYNTTYSELNNFVFEGKEYEIVRTFEKKDSNGTFQKLIIAKDIGIVGLVDIFSNSWVLKTEVKIRRLDEPERQRRNIVINNVSGCR